MPEPLLRALDVDVRRRVDGLLAGDFRSVLLGEGTELAQVRAYVPGDDVRQIEWNVTARTREAHVKVHHAERALTTWLVLDDSPSMAFGTADRRKADVAEGVSLAVAHIATRRANRLGVMTFGGAQLDVTRPSQGRAGLLSLLLTLRRRGNSTGDGVGLNAALARAGAALQTRSAIFIVSDFRGDLDWARALGRLAHRNEVFAVEIVDPREQRLVDIGDVYLSDPESGRQVRVDTRDRALRERFEREAALEREEVRRVLRRAGANHVALSTAGDWLRTLAGFLTERRRG
jgi:uncharacterized protein (DUF58 family)